MKTGNQTRISEVSGCLFFLFFILLDCRKPSSTRQVCQCETKEAVTALQSLSVGYGATDDKNKMFDPG